MDSREQAISTIEALYPADSQYEQTNEIGRQLLQQAKEQVNGWRNEPTEVLIRYAELCQAMEERQTRYLLRGKNNG